MGLVSSNIHIFFMGDELKHHKEENDESALKFLNHDHLTNDQKWCIWEKGIVCQLIGGGTTFHGAIYVRRELLQAGDWIGDNHREKTEVMKMVLKYYQDMDKY